MIYKKLEPKSKNITVRVTENQYEEFNNIAYGNSLSVSQWANYILSKHKDSYGVLENDEELILYLELAIESLEEMHEVLGRLKKEYNRFYDKWGFPTYQAKTLLIRHELKKIRKRLRK